MAWNGSSNGRGDARRNDRGARPSRVRNVVAALLIVVVASLVFFATRHFLSGERDEARPTDTKSKRIAEAKPKISAKTQPAKNDENEPEQKSPERAREESKTADHGFPGLVADSSGQLWYRGVKVPDEAPGAMRRNGKPYGPRKYFKKATDNYLASMFITGLLGGRSAASGDLSPKFLAALEASLKEPVEFSPDDDEDATNVKQLMQALKDSLNDMIAKGGKIEDIIKDTRKEHAKITEARESYQRALRELIQKDGTTLQEVEDYLSAANSILKEHHAMPLRTPPMIDAKIRARNLKNARDKGGNGNE